MIQAILARRAQSAQAPQGEATPSREEMIAAIRARRSGAQPVAPKFISKEPEYGSILDKVGEGLGAIKTLGNAAGAGLGYLGGLSRTALAQMAQTPQSQIPQSSLEQAQALESAPKLVNTQDWIDALEGKAPPSAEYLTRAHVPEMGSVNVPYLGKVTGREAIGLVGDISTDPLMFRSVTKNIGQRIESAGKNLYKSGLNAIDLEGAKYGKEPVSELLMKEGVTGSAEGIQKNMDELAQKYLSQRDVVLKNARTGEVNMEKAMSPVLNEIYSLKMHGAPEEKQIASILEKRAKAYIKLGGKPSEEILRELPVQSKYTPSYSEIGPRLPEQIVETRLPVGSEYKAPYRSMTTQEGQLPIGKLEFTPGTFTSRPDEIAPGMFKYPEQFNYEMGQLQPERYIQKPSVLADVNLVPGKTTPGKTFQEQYLPQKPQTVLDVTEAKMGPSPALATKWKSAGYNRLPESKYAQAARTSVGQKLEKLKNYGLKNEIENAVGRASGSLKQEELKSLNEKLGQILTSQEKAAAEAAKEIKKNTITSVDAILGATSAVATHNPVTTAAIMGTKKLADFSKGTRFRTVGGKGLADLGRGVQKIPTGSAAIPRLLYSPWIKMKEEK